MTLMYRHHPCHSSAYLTHWGYCSLQAGVCLTRVRIVEYVGSVCTPRKIDGNILDKYRHLKCKRVSQRTTITLHNFPPTAAGRTLGFEHMALDVMMGLHFCLLWVRLSCHRGWVCRQSKCDGQSIDEKDRVGSESELCFRCRHRRVIDGRFSFSYVCAGSGVWLAAFIHYTPRSVMMVVCHLCAMRRLCTAMFSGTISRSWRWVRY